MSMNSDYDLSSQEESKIYNAVQQIEAMKAMEERYQCCDYSLDIDESSENDGEKVDNECRKKMVEWCFQVVQFYDIEREIVVVGISYVDRYIGKLTDRSILKNRKQYQLLVMTSIYLATKVFGTKVIDINLLVNLGRDTYKKEEFEKMERDILTTLQWRVHPPSSTSFIRHLLMIASMLKMDKRLMQDLEKLSCFQIEKGLYDYETSLLKPSVLAVCAITNSFDHEIFDSFASETKSNFIMELMKICHIDLNSKDVKKGRYSLFQDIFPSSNQYAKCDDTKIEDTKSHSTPSNIRHSPTCISR